MVTQPPPETPDAHDDASNNQEPTDAELIARSVNDPRSFMPLVQRHHRILFGYLARRVGPTIAEDVTSETFTRAFAMRHRYDTTRADARPWLFGIATNLLRTHARSEVRQLRAYARHGVHDRDHLDDAAIDARLDASAQGQALAQALEQLKPADRETLLMYALGDMSYEDIGAALDIPVGTVRSRLNRARRIVQDQLGDPSSEADSSSTGASRG
jgi:RNA polymerase sigma-70 factor (ECF subfamily)